MPGRALQAREHTVFGIRIREHVQRRPNCRHNVPRCATADGTAGGALLVLIRRKLLQRADSIADLAAFAQAALKHAWDEGFNTADLLLLLPLSRLDPRYARWLLRLGEAPGTSHHRRHVRAA